MRLLIRGLLVGFLCVAAGVGAALWVTSPSGSRGNASDRERGRRGPAPTQDEAPKFDVFMERLEDGGFSLVEGYETPIHDSQSLQDLRESVRGRGRRAISALMAKYDAARGDGSPTPKEAAEIASVQESLGRAHMYEGKFDDAARWFEKALRSTRNADLPSAVRSRLTALRGIVALRQGEIENCLECIGASSCIFPLDRAAVHRNQEGSREAIRWFTAYLEEQPTDLRIVWLLNIAYMTVGEYPEKVPPRYLIPARLFRSQQTIGRFENVAARAGLGVRGPNQAGGSVFDDFTGDGLPDLFTTSLDADLGASFFVNRGDGTFDDRSASAGLGDQIYALNIARADFDNDGHPDVVLLRGGWERPLRLSLLRNRGDGTFEDVTLAAGMGDPITTEAAAWGDYDNDGRVDLFVCGEFVAPGQDVKTATGDPRNRCRLYHNDGNGRFTDVAAAAGVTNERCAKGVAWGDYDGDGRLDLFVSNMGQPSRMYHNEGKGQFRDVAPALNVTGSVASFACWFWDFDNDGRLDLYVNDYGSSIAQAIASLMGVNIPGPNRPRLYRNLGTDGFRDVAPEVGLDRALAPMGANFGDIDNDGYLDVYFGTGHMAYAGLEPNVLLRNVDGRRFEDVTTSAGTGHLQKGHGVSFADYDGDGDLDVFVELGGGTPGDQGYNALFQNPGQGRHWLKVKLVGTTTNRSALGAHLKAEIHQENGPGRTIHRTVGNNSSFGGNSLVETFGFLDGESIETLTVSWPTGPSTQTFRDLAADQSIEITEGTDSFKRLEPSQRASSKP